MIRRKQKNRPPWGTVFLWYSLKFFHALHEFHALYFLLLEGYHEGREGEMPPQTFFLLCRSAALPVTDSRLRPTYRATPPSKVLAEETVGLAACTGAVTAG